MTDIVTKAKKSLGQNFLVNQHVAQIIAKQIPRDDYVVEIGCGTLALTTELINIAQPKRLIAIEKDYDLCEKIPVIKNFELICGDALKVDFLSIIEKEFNNEPFCLVGNLPYNIGTQILLNALKLSQRGMVKKIIIMLQEEVVNRIVARPRCKDYGRLSVICQAICKVKKIHSLSPGSFRPMPKVRSAVVELIPLNIAQMPSEEMINRLEKICLIGFSSRRKIFLSVVKKQMSLYFIAFSQQLKNEGYSDSARIEELSIETLIRLAAI